MTPIIYCKPIQKGIHSFYLATNSNEYFLFNQNYRKGVQYYFGKGVTLNHAINFSKSNGDTAIIKTMSKLPIYIKYIEKEYEITILNQTKKRQNSNYFYHKKFYYA